MEHTLTIAAGIFAVAAAIKLGIEMVRFIALGRWE